MGYNLFSYGIKTTKIQSVFGCKDQVILNKIKATAMFKNYDDFQPTGFETSPSKALEDIINAATYDKTSGFAYGYAVITICAAFGHELPYNQEIKLGYETDFINQYLDESFDIKDLALEDLLLADDTNPFQIPPIEDWPVIGWLSNALLVELKDEMKHIHIADEDISKLQEREEEEEEEKGFAYEHIRGVIKNIDYCVENNLDLITFCH